MRLFLKSAIAGMLILAYASCSDALGPGNQANDRISIVNDPSALAGRVTYFNTPIVIDDTGVGYPSAPVPFASASVMGSAASPAAFSLTLVAEVAPPTVGGQLLQATSVNITGTRAIVSYNMRGNPYVGGIDVYDFSSSVILKSEALFQNTDVSSAMTSGSSVFLAEATGDTGFAAPAVVEKMRIVGTSLVLVGNQRKGLTSFAATSVTTSGTKAYITTGDAGKLFRVDTATFALLDSISLPDARWVDVYGGKVVVVQGGSPSGRIRVYNEANLTPLGNYTFTGADITQSKSTVQVYGNKAFIAAGRGGVQILSAITGRFDGTVARPNPALLGLGDSVVVTNAVAVSDDLMFISNGEAGVYVARGSQSFLTSSAEANQTITILGKLRFSSLQSVNHVAYVPPYLVIASGLGGIKLVKVTF
jgi:hypothetical protein